MVEEATERFTLLLVDDNPTNLLLLGKIVEFDLPQVRVLTARSGQEGLDLAQQESIDGAFIDVQMPQMSGLDMCRLLKAEPKTAGIPVVLITAHLASAEMRAEGLEVGAYDFISQPISNVEMLARIKVMLRLCRSEQQLRQDKRELQLQVDDHSENLRWLSGLLMSGDGSINEQDQHLVRRLAAELPDQAGIDEQQFAETLSRDFPLPWRRTLFKLALLDEIPISLARRISEIADIEAVFDYLQRHQLLLQHQHAKRDWLDFKPQVRSWLSEQAKQQLSVDDQRQLLRFAADWYQQQENPLAAFRLLLRAEDYQAISLLLSQSALQLLQADSLPGTLELVKTLPEETAATCGWLSLLVGTQKFFQQPHEADSWLELARARFEQDGDVQGEILTLTQQVRQYRLIDGRIDLGRQRLPRLQQLLSEHEDRLEQRLRLRALLAQTAAQLFFAGSIATVETALINLLPELQRLGSEELLLEAYLLRATLSLQQGRLRVARADMEQARAFALSLPGKPLMRLCQQVIACELLLEAGALEDYRRQRQITEKTWGRSFLRQLTFGPLLQLFDARQQLAQGDLAQARELIEMALSDGPAAHSPHLQSWLRQFRGYLRALDGEEQEALTDLELGLKLREQAGGPLQALNNRVVAAATCIALQRYEQAEQLLAQAHAEAKETGEGLNSCAIFAWQALLQQRQEQLPEAKQSLAEMFRLLHRQQRRRFLGQTPEMIKELLPLAVANSEQHDLLEKLTYECLAAGLDGQEQLQPILQVQTLGGFVVRCGGELILDMSEVGQSGRQLFAQLLATPSQALSLEYLMASLWPDSPVDKARASCDTTLSRLRKALDRKLGERGSRRYLVLEKGVLMLRHVQGDCQDFIRAGEEVRRHLQRDEHWQAELALLRADRCWQGEFLVGYELEGELPYYREQLMTQRLDNLQKYAEYCEKRQALEEACEQLQIGLRLDPTHDPFVRQLCRLLMVTDDGRRVRQVVENYRQALIADEYDTEEIDEIIQTLHPEWLQQ